MGGFSCSELSPSACADLASDLQLAGTQASFLDAHVVLNTSLSCFPDDASLWRLFAKLHTFYLVQWSVAETATRRAVELDPENVNGHLFRGWLLCSPPFINAEGGGDNSTSLASADKSFRQAIQLAESESASSSGNSERNFWPLFEYAVFLSHVAEDFTGAEENFERALAFSPENRFVEFFFGLLLKHRLGKEAEGQKKIDKAFDVAREKKMPMQAASNFGFQAIILSQRGALDREPEVRDLCDLAAELGDPLRITTTSLVCLSARRRRDISGQVNKKTAEEFT
uniref:Uncharacterized protein n=1 Tax=Chromera velia CCMP2878 TaxID=1169474 RepID=A0A0G4GVP3_9ALVE|eukprot:Cvel_23559.t1-p1 / transcript=Cvel_23559.t1 / gene=Cvel_23559 / organism=Chromera_velia_CCMP2878 / gene_product=hypothetical protein / transcript_product=hypothetical protein / location=Cvel_scaffold2441:24296-25144(-) / protein_length=283 / sequence_SO=supercontig / SO=protein_coding / is_pseudo=false